jgi:hypothetical protein
VGVWSDPDVGDPADDLVGCDVRRGLGYAYNATNSDAVYGSNPPSAGFDLLQGPSAGGGRLPTTSFTRYINGTDPSTAAHVYGYFRGFDPGGAAIIDPTTSQPTAFMVSGDPIAGTGWIDVDPADRRILLGSGPFTMAPGDSQEIVVAVMAGQGSDRFDSILRMKAADDAAQTLFDRPTPVTVAWLEAWPAYPGIKLRWWLGEDRNPLEAWLERAEDPDGPWSRTSDIDYDDEGAWGIAVDDEVEAGRTYYYRLVANGAEGPTVLARASAVSGARFGIELSPPTPNPSAGAVQIDLALPEERRVRLAVLDLQGREVALLVEGIRDAGRYRFTWDGRSGGSAVAPGIYFVRVESEDLGITRRIVVSR